MRISDWSSDVCSSDLRRVGVQRRCRDVVGLAQVEEHVRAEVARGQVAIGGQAQVAFLLAREHPGAVAVARDHPGKVAHVGDLVQQPGRVLAVGEQRSEEHTSELQSLMSHSYAVFCLKTKQVWRLMIAQ